MSATFNPNKHTIKVQGNREYLPVAARIVWFRQDYPEWSIITEPVEIDHEQEFAVFRCTISNEQGRAITTALKKEDRKGFGDWMEKAETGSVGRALAFLGYGTLGAKDFQEGDRLMDTPLPAVDATAYPTPNTPTPSPQASGVPHLTQGSRPPRHVAPSPEPVTTPEAEPTEEADTRPNLLLAFAAEVERLGLRERIEDEHGKRSKDNTFRLIRTVLALPADSIPTAVQIADAIKGLFPWKRRLDQQNAKAQPVAPAIEEEDPTEPSGEDLGITNFMEGPEPEPAPTPAATPPKRTTKQAKTLDEAKAMFSEEAAKRGFDIYNPADWKLLVFEMVGDSPLPVATMSDLQTAYNLLSTSDVRKAAA